MCTSCCCKLYVNAGSFRVRCPLRLGGRVERRREKQKEIVRKRGTKGRRKGGGGEPGQRAPGSSTFPHCSHSTASVTSRAY